MKIYTLFKGALLLCGLSFSAAAFAGASGEMLAGTCAGCHGTNGVSTGPAMPTIAGLDYDYLVISMQEYQKGLRRSTVMTRIAKGFNDEEISAMSKFFADQKYVLAKQDFDAAAAARGAEHHEKFCRNCHEDSGTKQDPDADTGMLGGQWKPYLDYTVVDYLAGKRDMSRQMRRRFDRMYKETGEQGFADLHEYYASQYDAQK